MAFAPCCCRQRETSTVFVLTALVFLCTRMTGECVCLPVRKMFPRLCPD